MSMISSGLPLSFDGESGSIDENAPHRSSTGGQSSTSPSERRPLILPKHRQQRRFPLGDFFQNNPFQAPKSSSWNDGSMRKPEQPFASRGPAFKRPLSHDSDANDGKSKMAKLPEYATSPLVGSPVGHDAVETYHSTKASTPMPSTFAALLELNKQAVADFEALKKELKEKENEAIHLRTELKDAQDLAKQREIKFKGLTERAKHGLEGLDDVKRKWDDHRAKYREVVDLFDKEKITIDEVRGALREAQERVDEALNEDGGRLRNLADRSKAILQSYEEHFATLDERYNLQKEHLSRALGDLSEAKDRISTLEKSLETAHSAWEKEAEDIKTLHLQKDKLRDDLLTKERALQEALLDAARLESEQSKLRDDLSATQRELQEAVDKTAHQEDQQHDMQKDLSKKERLLQDAQLEAVRLEERIAMIEKSLETTHTLWAKNAEDLKDISDQRDKLQKDLSAKESELQQALLRMKHQEGENDRLRGELSVKESELREVQLGAVRQGEMLQDKENRLRNDTLQQSLNDTNPTRAGLDKHVEDLKRKLDNLAGDKARAEELCASLQKDQKQQAHEHQQLLDAEKDVHHRLQESQKEVGELSAKIASLEASKKELEKAVQESTGLTASVHERLARDQLTESEKALATKLLSDFEDQMEKVVASKDNIIKQRENKVRQNEKRTAQLQKELAALKSKSGQRARDLTQALGMSSPVSTMSTSSALVGDGWSMAVSREEGQEIGTTAAVGSSTSINADPISVPGVKTRTGKRTKR